MTFAEKVLVNHLRDPHGQELRRGRSDANFDPDRVALQDALAQIVALQFMTAGLDEVVVPTTIHCDHLIRAKVAAADDLETALDVNAEVYDFLRAVAARYGIGFWKPGSGIIHQVVFENYAFPGGMMIGTDSHTPNAGGMGMVAVGVGGGDAIDAMTGRPFNIRWPKLIGVRLTGALNGWSSPKDVILRVAQVLTVKGGTGAVVEYFGPGTEWIAATGKGTICNMGAEIGATTSLFPFDDNIAAYLRATGRGGIADAAISVAADLRADPEVEADPGRFFDEVIEIDLGTLLPMINGPDSPDLGHQVSEVGVWARGHGVPVEISAALIGSCTNSSYEDISRAASHRPAGIRRGPARASAAVHHARLRAGASHDRTRRAARRSRRNRWHGPRQCVRSVHRPVGACARRPGAAEHDREQLQPQLSEAQRRQRQHEVVRHLTRHGHRLRVGRNARLQPAHRCCHVGRGRGCDARCTRRRGPSARGFDPGKSGNVPAARAPSARSRIDVTVSPTSNRLQLLQPFAEWNGNDYVDLPVLLKAKGKCTTDHISAAGRWLDFRGHLENISGNLFLGVVNAFTGAVGTGKDPVDAETRAFPEIAAHLAVAGVRWCAVGDENYGEGSSRSTRRWNRDTATAS